MPRENPPKPPQETPIKDNDGCLGLSLIFLLYSILFGLYTFFYS